MSTTSGTSATASPSRKGRKKRSAFIIPVREDSPEGTAGKEMPRGTIINANEGASQQSQQGLQQEQKGSGITGVIQGIVKDNKQSTGVAVPSDSGRGATSANGRPTYNTDAGDTEATYTDATYTDATNTDATGTNEGRAANFGTDADDTEGTELSASAKPKTKKKKKKKKKKASQAQGVDDGFDSDDLALLGTVVGTSPPGSTTGASAATRDRSRGSSRRHLQQASSHAAGADGTSPRVDPAVAGTGTLTYRDGAVYRGSFQRGLRHGRGTMTFPDGTRESGTWRSGKLHGPACLRERPDGSRYEGPMVNGVEHGAAGRLISPARPLAEMRVPKGEQYASLAAAVAAAAAKVAAAADARETMAMATATGGGGGGSASGGNNNNITRDSTTRDGDADANADDNDSSANPSSANPSSVDTPSGVGSTPQHPPSEFNVYTGPFEDGEMSGDGGRLEMGLTGGKYAGSVRRGRPHGHGTFVFNTRGAWAKGEWRDGRLHGPGRHVREDGSSFAGDFEHGRRVRGTLTLPQGKGTVRGNFERGVIVDGTIINARGDTFSGTFDKDQRLHGRGTVVYANGLKYTGTFEHGTIEGHGVLEMVDGSVYKGDLRDNRPHGWGTLTRADGSEITGEWAEGRAKVKPPRQSTSPEQKQQQQQQQQQSPQQQS